LNHQNLFKIIQIYHGENHRKKQRYKMIFSWDIRADSFLCMSVEQDSFLLPPSSQKVKMERKNKKIRLADNTS